MSETMAAALPRVDTPLCCRVCGIVLHAERLRARAYVCDCGFPLAPPADAWIALLADPGSWHEHWGDLRPADFLGWERPSGYASALHAAEAGGLAESVRAGSARAGGHAIWLAVFDFRFI